MSDDYVLNSRFYRAVLSDARIQEDSSYLSYDYEAVIKISDEVDSMYCSLQALESDKGIKFDEAELDNSPFMQDVSLVIAKLCSGPHAHDTWSLYLHDSGLEQCQLYIAINYPYFFTKVDDKATLMPSAVSYLALTA